MKRVDLARSRKTLALIWFPGAGLLLALLFLQTLLGRYGERVEEAWGWMLPTVVPTLALILGVLVTGSRPIGDRPTTVSRFLASLTVALSLLYLITVGATILLSPWAELHGSMTPLGFMRTSQFWLAPFQGLVTASLGAFFSDSTSPGSSTD